MESWIDYVLVLIHHKKILSLLIVVMMAIEWRRGSFKGLVAYAWMVTKDIRRQTLPVLCVAGVLAACIYGDRYWVDFFQLLSYETPEFWIRLGAHLGDKYLLIYFLFTALKFGSGRKAVAHVVFSCLLAGLFSGVLKLLSTRARPLAELGPSSFLNFRQGVFGDDGMFQSFPSGDVTIVAAAVFYLMIKFPARIYLWFLLILPAFTALSRIQLEKHWPSDAMAAFFLAHAAAIFVAGHESYSKA